MFLIIQGPGFGELGASTPKGCEGSQENVNDNVPVGGSGPGPGGLRAPGSILDSLESTPCHWGLWIHPEVLSPWIHHESLDLPLTHLPIDGSHRTRLPRPDGRSHTSSQFGTVGEARVRDRVLNPSDNCIILLLIRDERFVKGRIRLSVLRPLSVRVPTSPGVGSAPLLRNATGTRPVSMSFVSKTKAPWLTCTPRSVGFWGPAHGRRSQK